MNTQTTTDIHTWLFAVARSGSQDALRLQRGVLDACFDMTRLWTTTWAAWVDGGMRTAGSLYHRGGLELPLLQLEAIVASQSTGTTAEPSAPTPDVPATEAEEVEGNEIEADKVEPAATADADQPANDDLKMISGIGPGTEKKLHERGIVSFSQIAALTDEDIERLDTELRFRGRIRRDDWIGQAEKLAAGDSTEFSRRYIASQG